MILQMLVVLATTSTPVAPAMDMVAYGALIDQAVHDCRNARGKEIDIGMLWKLAEIENQYNPAREVRGMILAAACVESGYNPNAKGDRKFSKSGKKPMAIGILQMWPIYEKMYPGLDRTNPYEAAHAWMKHIVKMVPKVKRQCRYKKPEKIWVAAWVTGIRYKKKGGRCKEKPKHLRVLKRWQRNIAKNAKATNERKIYLNTSSDADPDGC